jgi:hypothetical protein
VNTDQCRVDLSKLRQRVKENHQHEGVRT